jgi:hypothetical protein
MKQPIRVSKRQLTLALEREAKPLPAENTQEELVNALADLLLEALREETDQPTNEQRGGDESEDYA